MTVTPPSNCWSRSQWKRKVCHWVGTSLKIHPIDPRLWRHSSENRLLWHRPLTTKPLSNIVSEIVSIAQQSSTMLIDVDSSREKNSFGEFEKRHTTSLQLVSRTTREQPVDLPSSTQGLISPSDNVLLVLSRV